MRSTPRAGGDELGYCRVLMNKQVAGEIGVSEITVKIHRGHAM